MTDHTLSETYWARMNALKDPLPPIWHRQEHLARSSTCEVVFQYLFPLERVVSVIATTSAWTVQCAMQSVRGLSANLS